MEDTVECSSRDSPAGPADAITAGGVPADARLRDVYDTHAEPLLRFLTRLCLGERNLAEDLLQETMMRAWRNIDALATDRETQRRWLFTVARRIAIDAARARQARPPEIGDLDLSRMPTGDDPAEQVVAARTVSLALPRISPEHRTVLVGLYYRGLSTAEIAAKLRIPEGTVKSRAHYALRALRAAIGPVTDV